MVRFEVERVLRIRGEAVVFARVLDGADFRVSAGSQLGGVSIQEYLEQPRALGDDGKERLDLFAFILSNLDDDVRVVEGSVIELTDG